MNHLRQSIQKVAPTNSRVMITGPQGSGKELAARYLHASSQRENGPFVAVNAASMAPDRVENEFFGVEETGQTARKVGALEEAHNGTLYIDEVADMPVDTQGKLLRVLVEQKFQRVGGGPKVSVDVRIVSSTSRDLEREMTAGRFRQDLFHRLNVVPLRVPSLVERREDIPELVEHFVKQVAQSSGLPPRIIGDDAMAVLQSHEWQGNVRQLRNIVERVMIMSTGDPDTVITADMLPDDIGANVPLSSNGSGGEHLMSLPLRDAREIFEREYLMAQINRFGGNISRTAEFVGMERSALHRKLRALGVNSNERAGAGMRTKRSLPLTLPSRQARLGELATYSVRIRKRMRMALCIPGRIPLSSRPFIPLWRKPGLKANGLCVGHIPRNNQYTLSPSLGEGDALIQRPRRDSLSWGGGVRGILCPRHILQQERIPASRRRAVDIYAQCRI